MVVVDGLQVVQMIEGFIVGCKVVQEWEYLVVFYGECIVVKVVGVEWDKVVKFWYVGLKVDMEKLVCWKFENVFDQQGLVMMLQEEFVDVLCFIGCVVSGEYFIMDGKKYCISVEGEKFSEKVGLGFYVGYFDGYFVGYMKNNKIGIDMKWKFKGYIFDFEEKVCMVVEVVIKLQVCEVEQVQVYEVIV